MLLTLIMLLVLAAVLAVGWVFSNSILKPLPYGLMDEFEILAVSPGEVTLPLPPNGKQFANTLRTGRFNLLWEGGYGHLGAVLAKDETSVRRELSSITGRDPEAGERAQLEAFIYRRDPLQDFGLEHQNLLLEGDVGPLRAWWLPQDTATAVLMLHGRRRGDITETLRVLPTMHELGYSVLALSYRNHTDSAMSPDGFYHYGQTEWQDAVTGLKFLSEQGVSRVVLYGFSMGGAVATETLKNYPEAGLPEPQALVLDAPLLDPPSVFRRGARNMGLPLPDLVTNLALFTASLRSGINWESLDQRRYAPNLGLPVLLISGTEDQTTPISMVDAFAAKAPDLEYHRVEGADHVESWNHDPEQYEAWLRTFLRKHAPLD